MQPTRFFARDWPYTINDLEVHENHKIFPHHDPCDPSIILAKDRRIEIGIDIHDRKTQMKRITKSFLFIVIVLPLFFSHANAEMYKWVDDDGTVTFSDDLLNIPPSHRSGAKKIDSRMPAQTGIESTNEFHVPFFRTPSGIMLVDVVLNGSVRARMVFDTGAAAVIISRELWQKLNQGDTAGDKRVKLRTAGGEVEGRYTVIQRIELGPASRDNVQAVINPQANVFQDFDGLLGMSFLADFQVSIDNQGGKIILKRK
jgi:clan AA aspartic protease (TIGR02281 family)